jgi:hypothetical protein
MNRVVVALLLVVLLVGALATPARAGGGFYWPWPVALLAAPFVVASTLVAAPFVIVGSAVAAPPSVVYAPPIAVAPPIPIAVAPSAAPGPPAYYWYYCPDSAAYYPYVKRCATSWLTVVPPTGPPPTLR